VLLDGKDRVQVHPTLFAPPEQRGDELRLLANPGGDEAIVTVQLARELPRLLAAAKDLAQRTVTLVWPGAGRADSGPLAAAVAELRAANPRRLLLDDGRGRSAQLHPQVAREGARVLGRNDALAPPLLMLGIDQGRGPEHAARVIEKLGALRDQVLGRRVLLVLQDESRDLPGRDADTLLQTVRAAVDPLAAATLVWRGVDAARRPYFEVVQSKIDGLAAGARMADPRTKR
jgi:hypothetical protein